MSVTRQQWLYLAALPAAFTVLLAGLLTLAAHAFAATLIMLAAMALLLCLVAGFCQSPEIRKFIPRKR